VYLLVDLGFYPPLNFCEASPFVPPTGWMPLTDTTGKETNKQTNGWTKERRDTSLRPSFS